MRPGRYCFNATSCGGSEKKAASFIEKRLEEEGYTEKILSNK
jgi:phage replication-related protein YjqB (UPF0714/DUF867 family)